MEQELSACLASTLSPDQTTRSSAEQHLNRLASPDTDPEGQLAIALTNLFLDQSTQNHIRQSAGLALKKFITTRWSPYFDSFTSHAIQPQVKQHVRTSLLRALADPIRKIRLAASYAISTIAGPDYPDQFPELLPHLQHLLGQAEPNSTHGAMALLSDFVRVEMDEVQLMQVANEFLPTLETVLADEQRLTPHVRARCILVFRQCLTTLFMVKDTYPDAVKTATHTLLPRWLSAMEALLTRDAAADLANAGENAWETLAIRNEIFRTIKTASFFRKQFKPFLPNFVNLALANLTSLLPAFHQIYLSSSTSDSSLPTPTPAEEGDSDVATDIPSLACSILDFIAEASRNDRCRDLFLQGGTGGEGTETEAFSHLIKLMLVYVDMTLEDEENWANDANAFVADEDDDTMAYSLRIATADLLGTVIDQYPSPALRCLGIRLAERVRQGEEAKANGDQDWWKAHEGCLAAVGNNSEAISEILELENQARPEASLNIETIFTELVLPNVGDGSPPFLQGRCFVFASQFAKALPSQLATQFLEAAVGAIESETASMPVKISAVRTVKNFYRHLSHSLVSPLAPRIIRQLGPLLTRASEDTLVLVVETIQSVLAEDRDLEGEEVAGALIHNEVEPEVIGNLVEASLQVWAPNARDIILLSVVSDLLESLASSKSSIISRVVVERSLPILSAAIVDSLKEEEEEEEEPSALAESAVELTLAVLQGAKADHLQGVVGVLCPNLFRVLRKSKDRDVIQNGLECLTLLVKKSHLELFSIDSALLEEGEQVPRKEAMQIIMEILARQLGPEEPESGGLAVGKLVVSLLRKSSERVLPYLEPLLQAMVKRLATAKTASFCQSLLSPFTFLIKDQAQVVFDLLEHVQVEVGGQGGRNRNGLEILCEKWVENHETLQGLWSQRLSCISLIRLFESKLVVMEGGGERDLLQNLLVQGDLLPDPEGETNVIRTRSKAKLKPHRYSSIPLGSKVLKLVLKEYASVGKETGGRKEGTRTPQTDDEDQDWDDEDQNYGAENDTQVNYLSDIIGQGDLDSFLRGEEEEDELLQDDEMEDDELEIIRTDLNQLVPRFVKACVDSDHNLPPPPRFQSLCQYLNQEESAWLKMAINS
ncbi:ARM repeat-containing protein [Violaceomyces palustris]|uniref:ARM repeat-containing protein n=1 Tax=Violaceomyces palustris TaxID=1673888 RepID=A0ACD0NLN4_9BASI|nr:ARM repeat-containing protein [Violaceomyces palustris]